ncbi:MAG: hydroxymethylpyrimidine/phosphomethylpyrimidine kinase [Candidatus Cloacimonetes bacterium]|nr:hydroxymethylpyrimidine/phosphomethylpyrimidine kinase [Candidatus Cloacimonadota bacterium]
MKYFMTIAASDNSGGAGIQQDLKIAEKLEWWGLSAITGITVQNFQKLDHIYPVEPTVLKQQIEKCFDSFPVKAVKIGAICSQENLNTIVSCLHKYKPKIVVADAVFAPTRGKGFLDEEGIRDFREKLLPLVTIIKPNKGELELLCGSEFPDFDSAIEGAKELSCEYGCAIFLSGGHFEGDNVREAIIDNIFITILEKKRHNWKYSHGTGCALTTALACSLHEEITLAEASRQASAFVSDYYNEINQEFFKDTTE